MSDRRVLVKVFAARDQAARKKERSQLLDEFVEMSGPTRLHACRLSTTTTADARYERKSSTVWTRMPAVVSGRFR